MIFVTREAKPFLRAGKGTIMRRSTCDIYAKEIEGLYQKRDLIMLVSNPGKSVPSY